MIDEVKLLDRIDEIICKSTVISMDCMVALRELKLEIKKGSFDIVM